MDPDSIVYLNADPDPAVYLDEDPDPAVPDPAVYFNADLNPAFYFNAGPDPAIYLNAITGTSFLCFKPDLFYLIAVPYLFKEKLFKFSVSDPGRFVHTSDMISSALCSDRPISRISNLVEVSGHDSST